MRKSLTLNLETLTLEGLKVKGVVCRLRFKCLNLKLQAKSNRKKNPPCVCVRD